MIQTEKLHKARLIEIEWNKNGQVKELPSDKRKEIEVQFNPQTLKLSFTNQRAGGDQRGGAANQFIGRGKSSLSLDLFFDVSVLAQDKNSDNKNDVRDLTYDIAYFLNPKKINNIKENEVEYIPPGLRFCWGTFLFEGIMESMNETLELFSPDGRPLRASVSISLFRQEIQYRFDHNKDELISKLDSGRIPLHLVQLGDNLPQMIARTGQCRDWKEIAQVNDIDNPRILTPGKKINLTASNKKRSS